MAAFTQREHQIYEIFTLLNFFIMKTLSIIFYVIGSGLLIASCFVSTVSATWWLGGSAVVALILGCIFQFNANRNAHQLHHL